MATTLVSTGITFPDSTTQTTKSVDYTHPNHSGDVTSTADGATVIANGAVTDAKIGTMSSSKLTGALPAISGAALTNLPAGGATSLDGLSDCTVSASEPTASTNPSATGHQWINSATGHAYICTDATTDANYWTNIGAGAGDMPAVWSGDTGIFTIATVSDNRLKKISIPTTGNNTAFATLSLGRVTRHACSNGTRGVFGSNVEATNVMDYVTIASAVNAVDFGDLALARSGADSCSDGLTGIIAGGQGGSTYQNVIEYITIASASDSIDYSNLTVARSVVRSASNSVRAVFAGGYTYQNTMDYITIASSANAIDFGDLTISREVGACVVSDTRAVFCSGYGGAGYANTMDYITVATAGNATDFGDLSGSTYHGWTGGGCSNGVRGVIIGGINSNSMTYITIASTGNTASFGTVEANTSYVGACSGD